MFRYLAEDIAFLLIKNKILDIEDRDIYVYGLEAILLNSLLLIAMFLVSLPFGAVMHFLGFVVFFIPLRMFVGGYHAKRSETCFVVSVVIYVITLVITMFNPYIYRNRWLMVVTIISLVILLVWSPVINPKHPLADYQIKRNKKIAYTIIALEFALFLVFCKLNLTIASSLEVFILTVTIVFLIGKVETKVKSK